jgi:hypothetical protein
VAYHNRRKRKYDPREADRNNPFAHAMIERHQGRNYQVQVLSAAVAAGTSFFSMKLMYHVEDRAEVVIDRIGLALVEIADAAGEVTVTGIHVIGGVVIVCAGLKLVETVAAVLGNWKRLRRKYDPREADRNHPFAQAQADGGQDLAARRAVLVAERMEQRVQRNALQKQIATQQRKAERASGRARKMNTGAVVKPAPTGDPSVLLRPPLGLVATQDPAEAASVAQTQGEWCFSGLFGRMKKEKAKVAHLIEEEELKVEFAPGVARTPPAAVAQRCPAQHVRFLCPGKAVLDEDIALIKRATRVVKMAVYTFDLEGAVEALCAKLKEGISVKIIVDAGATRASTTASQSDSLTKIIECGGEVRLTSGSSGSGQGFPHMHAKVLIVDDGKACIVGSANWTNATLDNFEMAFLVERGQAVGDADEAWERLWWESREASLGELGKLSAKVASKRITGRSRIEAKINDQSRQRASSVGARSR